MDFLSIDNVMRQAKSIIVNPQVATYACIGITTTILAYYTIFENDESSKPEERKEAPIEEPEEKESPIEEDSAQESVEEEPAAPLAGGKRKKMSRMNKNKDKKNKSKRKQSK